IARSSWACASASLFCSPQVMVPRHTVETSSSVPGSVRYFIVSPVACLSLGAGWKDSRSRRATRRRPGRRVRAGPGEGGSGRGRIRGVEGGVPVGTGLPVGDDAGEVEALPVHQVRGNDAPESREGVLDPAGKPLLPFAQHLLGGLSLQVGLGAA